MSVFKCKMCGGAMKIDGQAYGTCPYCGTQQTFPKLDDERRAQMYDRANEFRRLNEFDKALGIYEQILSEEPTDAEAYWSVVLCTYGVEYVEDPTTHKRIPTVNRAQYTSIYADKNYLSALANADSNQKILYENEAKKIDEIQKGILEVSSKEEPYDIFICYKETDANGRRTHDSVYAYDIYDALTKEGYRVFFSRITLENKLGTAYESYIFAALNSAKVMIVVGTSKENFNAVWVKNEWARYLALMKNDNSKHLIPVYKDVAPTDLPDEFAYLQAQDMGKIGFIQDVVHGVSKLIHKDEPEKKVQDTVVINNSDANVAPLIKRIYMFIEDSDWNNANEYCERVLDINPECGEVYLAKLLIENKVTNIELLGTLNKPFANSNTFKKIERYCSKEVVSKVSAYKNDIDLLFAIKNGNIELVKGLLSKGANPNYERILDSGSRFSALYFSIVQWPNDEIAKILVEAGADVNYVSHIVSRDKSSDIPMLICAILKSNVEMVRYLLSKGANPNCESVLDSGIRYSALFVSIGKWPNDEIAKILVEAGADVNYVSHTATKDTVDNYPVLICAISKSNVEMVRYLLSKGANSNCEWVLDSGIRYSALFVSIVKWPNDEIAKILVEAGADVNYVGQIVTKDTVDNYPVLICAIFKSNVEMVRYLLSKGANPNCERILDDGSRYSALHDSIKLCLNSKITDMLASSLDKAPSDIKGLKIKKDDLTKESISLLKSGGCRIEELGIFG